MTDNLIPFLQTVITRVSPFMSSISFIHMKPLEDGRLYANATANDGTVILSSISKEPISLGDGNIKACLGNLPYLRELVNSPFLTNNCNININLRERNQKVVISTLQFIPNDRTEIIYMATDPHRANIMKPMQIELNEWPVDFIIDVEGAKEITDFKRIHAAAPSTGKEDILQIAFSNGEISIDFGIGGFAHSSTLILDTIVDATKKKTISVNLVSDMMLKAMNMSKDKDDMIPVSMSDKAIKMAVSDHLGDHEIILVGRKVRDE